MDSLYEKISSSRAKEHRISAFAGGKDKFTILSAKSVPHVLLSFFTTKTILPFRITCKDALKEVAEKPWHDTCTLIRRSVWNWRACFPRASAANLRRDLGFSGRCSTVYNGDFFYFRGLEYLNIAGCRDFTDEAFEHLRGIKHLNMAMCRTVTDAALINLRGSIQELDISYCFKLTFKSLEHLRGIQSLTMSDCLDMTDLGFHNLRGIKFLDISHCTRIGDSAFAQLASGNKEIGAGLVSLKMRGCCAITDEGISYLTGIRDLDMAACSYSLGSSISDKAFKYLKGIKSLDISHCSQFGDEALIPLLGIRKLNVSYCHNLTENSLLSLKESLQELILEGCYQLPSNDFWAQFLHSVAVHGNYDPPDYLMMNQN